ncbi:MAG: MGMT family protein [Eggerthellaceae bacterium]
MARTLLRRRRPRRASAREPARHRVPAACVGAARRDPVRPADHVRLDRASHRRADGARTSARAVGSAVGRNPISIILPCHRVVVDRQSHRLRRRPDKKIALLGIEGIDVDALSMPKKGVAL